MRGMWKQFVAVLLCLAIAGCQPNPATMPQAEVEALLQKSLAFKEMTITPNPGGGGYTGSGVATDGTKFKITVTQDVQARKLSYSAVSESDATEVKEGSLELK